MRGSTRGFSLGIVTWKIKKMIARMCQGNFERKITNIVDYNTNTHTQSQIKLNGKKDILHAFEINHRCGRLTSTSSF
jgi:hypothetical protein